MAEPGAMAEGGKMEIVAICGSPRGSGNTATLLEAMLDGARERGATTTRFDAAKMRIGDCDADRTCLESAEAGCILQDDMQQIYAALRRAQAWIFAGPVYFWNVSAPLKRVIDRLYAFYTEEGGWRLGLPGKRRGAVIVVQADPGQDTPTRVADYLTTIMRDLNVEVVGAIAEGSLGHSGDAAKRPDLLARARELGKQLASP
jgi:multimeric flavodoxin WrbA